MYCSTHAERQAAGVCTRCGRFFCGECLVPVSGRNLCRDCVTSAFEEQQRQQPASANQLPLIINNNNNASTSASASAAQGGTPYPLYPWVRKSPGLAAVLSFFIPGLGQVYCGRLGRGALFFLGSFLLVPIVIGFGIWIWNIVDAHSLAQRYPLP